MAIKYDTNTGQAHLNVKARAVRDMVLKPTLSGMKCSVCVSDSLVYFKQHQSYAGSGSVDWFVNACCPDFEKKIYEKLGVNR